ncbi:MULTISPECIES: PAS domain-containing sensor histidine kinase [Xanthomonas]|uniref:PAS domain-containing sensor histidine kinase n=1 Tax=Xanthomonas TaxID=338 RepID=UPI001E28D518|nr:MULTISPECIES: PAS domain-containing sensor histidine kinase [Xanthomonas]
MSRLHAYLTTMNSLIPDRQDWCRKVVELSADSIKCLSLSGEVLYANSHGMARMSNVVAEPGIGTQWTSLWSAEVQPLVLNALESARKGKSCDFEVQCVNAHDRHQYWHVSTSPLCDDGGEINAVLVVNRDITARRLAEFALETLKNSLRDSNRQMPARLNDDRQSFDGVEFPASSTAPGEETEPKGDNLAELDIAKAARRVAESVAEQAQKGEAIGQLLAGVVHDLNNVLHASRSAIGLVTSRRKIGSRDMQLLSMAEKALDHGAAMSKRLLSFAANHPYVVEQTDLGALTAQMMPLLTQAVGSGVKLELLPCTETCIALMDPHLVERALMNLVINARDACGDVGLIWVVVSTSSVSETDANLHRAAGDYISVSVRDNGEGIAPAVRARLFEAYFSTKPSGKGTGLGLAQVYGAVRQANGHVDVQSEPGHGACFTMSFPRL